MNLKRILSLLAMAALIGSAKTAQADTLDVSNAITGSVTWYSTNTYVLHSVVYVQTNATLIIEPGTVVKAATTNTSYVFATPGIPNPVTALWVARGGKLYATGTVTKPIVFTVENDDLNDANDLPYNTSGLWGGIVLLGNGQINSAQNAAGQAATPRYEVYEGTTGAGAIPEQIFGGSDDTDSSGELKYVSIRYSGTVFAPAKELNSLTMGAIGSGTKISYVEAFNGSDDAFEWWGGVNSADHLVAAFCEDDDFDTDQGYRGTNQFLFGIKPKWAGSSDSRGLETDGDLSQTSYPANNAEPFCSWYGYNLTLIGRGTSDGGYGGGAAWMPRDEARPNIYNSVVADFSAGIFPENDCTNEFATGVADVRNTIWQVSSNVFGSHGAMIQFLFTETTRSNTVQNPMLGTVTYTNDLALLNPRPQSGSPALSGLTNGAPVAVSYRGAFAPNDDWADGWTALSTLRYLQPAQPQVSVVKSGNNVQITWNSILDRSYQLQSKSATIDDSWVNVGSIVTGTGGTMTNTQPVSANTYYRAVLANP